MQGGGIYVDIQLAELVLFHCAFQDNTGKNGGALYIKSWNARKKSLSIFNTSFVQASDTIKFDATPVVPCVSPSGCISGQGQGGFVSNYNSSACSKLTCGDCPKGMHRASNTSNDCISCTVGKFTEQSGQLLCKDCSVGMYNLEIGASICKNCEKS